MKKSKILSSFKKNLLLGSMVLGTLVINIYLVLLNVNSGLKLSELEKKESDIARINEDISAQLVKSTSLLALQAESFELGYAKNDNLVYIKDSETVASRF